MTKKKLGNSSLEISSLCFGGNVFGWTIDEPTSLRLLDAFLDAGGNFVDTADVYSTWGAGNKGGESETIIGNWLKKSGKRNEVVIATKVGMEMGPGKKGLAKDYIERSVEDSLRRLQTDHIDLYQSHKDDENTPLEETLGAYQNLIKQGKVRVIGASNYSAQRLQEALDTSRQNNLPAYQTLQPEYNLYDRAGYEAELQGVAKRYGLGVISYFSLAAGFLTGKYRSESDLQDRARGGKVKNYLNERGLRILDALDQVSKQHGVKPAQVALAWLEAQPTITAPIASATKVEQLKELMTEVKLDQASLDLLNEASAQSAMASA